MAPISASGAERIVSPLSILVTSLVTGMSPVLSHFLLWVVTSVTTVFIIRARKSHSIVERPPGSLRDWRKILVTLVTGDKKRLSTVRLRPVPGTEPDQYQVPFAAGRYCELLPTMHSVVAEAV